MILGRSNQTNTITNKFDGIDYNISVESCGYVDMFVEATEELAALESAMYVADIMLEEQVLEGATNIDVLLEGVVSSVFSRLSDAVQKLWAKIKQWFANVKKYFQMLFSHGKDFVKKYKTDIIKAEARCKGFKYEFYPLSGKVMDIKTTSSPDALAVARTLVGKGESTSEIVKSHMKAKYWNNEDSQAEFNKAYRESLLGGDAREEYEDFSNGPSVQYMISVLETGQKEIATLDKQEKEINKACGKLVADLKKAENDAAKEVASKDGSSLDKAYSLAVEIVKAEANHAVAACNTMKEVSKIVMKDSESVLKRLISHKPKKEGFEGGEEFNGSESLLEAAFKIL